jgi:hypothetical protein
MGPKKKVSKQARLRKKRSRRISERAVARPAEEEPGRSEGSSAVMDIEHGKWTGQERREGGERRILPDRRKTA